MPVHCKKCGGKDTVLLFQHYSCNKCDPPKDLDGNILACSHPWEKGYRILSKETNLRPFDVIFGYRNQNASITAAERVSNLKAKDYNTVLRPLFCGEQEDRIKIYREIKECMSSFSTSYPRQNYTLLTYISSTASDKSKSEILACIVRGRNKYSIEQANNIKPGIYNKDKIYLLTPKGNFSLETFKDLIGYK